MLVDKYIDRITFQSWSQFGEHFEQLQWEFQILVLHLVIDLFAGLKTQLYVMLRPSCFHIFIVYQINPFCNLFLCSYWRRQKPERESERRRRPGRWKGKKQLLKTCWSRPHLHWNQRLHGRGYVLYANNILTVLKHRLLSVYIPLLAI